MSARTKKNGAAKRHVPCECPDCRRDRREWKKLGRETLENDKVREAQKAQEKAEELLRPPSLVNWTDAVEATEKLRLYHHQLVESIAVDLKPRFAAGELCGTYRGGEETAGAVAMIAACRERIGSREDAAMILAFSPSTEGIAVDGNFAEELTENAIEALAADVLRVARLRRFYEMKPDESTMVW